jgi:hypothetical protein
VPYVFEDDDFKLFKEIVNTLAAEKQRITMMQQKLITAALLVMIDKATKAERPHAIGDARIAEDSDIEGLVVKASAAFASLLAHLSNEVGGVVMGKVNGVPWFFADELAPEACGFIPSFLNIEDERPMKEQINDHYIGGWHPFEGFQLKKKSWTIGYSGDPDMQPLAGAALHGEVLAVYPHAWVMIVQDDSSYEIARLD